MFIMKFAIQNKKELLPSYFKGKVPCDIDMLMQLPVGFILRNAADEDYIVIYSMNKKCKQWVRWHKNHTYSNYEPTQVQGEQKEIHNVQKRSRGRPKKHQPIDTSRDTVRSMTPYQTFMKEYMAYHKNDMKDLPSRDKMRQCAISWKQVKSSMLVYS